MGATTSDVLRDVDLSVIPSIVYETVEHARNCQQAASERLGTSTGVSVATLTNLYMRNSSKCATQTARQYIERVSDKLGGPQPSAPAGNLVQRAVAGDFPAPNEQLSSVAFRFRFLLRVLAHRAFRIMGRFVGESSVLVGEPTTVLRSWVDVSLDLFEVEKQTTVVLVYPFPLSISRQLRYIRHLRANGFAYRLAGFPYRLRSVIPWCFRPSDADLADLESLAGTEHADELMARYGLQQLLTAEEFEAATFAFCEQLRSRQVYVQNRAHGVGKYSPFISYDEFAVFNEEQIKYYKVYGRVGRFELVDDDVTLPPVRAPQAIVLIDQLISEDGSLLDALQRRIIDVIKIVAEKSNIDAAIKLHPNSKLSHLEGRQGVRHTRDIEWSPGEAIFLTVYSTAYLTFRRFGMTILVRDDLIDPSLVFGPGSFVVHVDALESYLLEQTIDA